MQLLASSDSNHDNLIQVLSHSVHQILAFRGDMAESSVTYLFEGLFPNFSRYLSGKSRYVSNLDILNFCMPMLIVSQGHEAGYPTTCVTVFTKPQSEAFSDSSPTDDQGSLIEGITAVIVEKDRPAKQLVAPRFISPHPSVTFAEVPATFGVQSDSVVTESVFDPTRPLFLRETTSPSPKPHKIEVKSLPAEGSSVTRAKAVPTSQQSPAVEAEPPAQILRPASSATFKLESRKCLNRKILRTPSLDRSRKVSTSSSETLVWSSNGSSSKSSPVASRSGRQLQHAAEKTIIKKQASKIHAQEEVCEELRIKLDDQARQSEELKADLKLCQRDRERNLDSALGLYRNTGILALLEGQNLLNQIHQLQFDVHGRESEIWSRDQLIEALRLDVDDYANREQWNRMRQSFHALQQQYGQMPQKLRALERNYESLEDQHLDLSNRFKKLERDHTELKAQCDQIRDERDQLGDGAQGSKPSSSEAEARYWALEVELDQILEEKARSEKKARAKEQFLTGLATRMFKRIIYMAGVHANRDVDPKDNEQTALCQLACKQLGFDATEFADIFVEAGPSGSRQVKDERNESGDLEKHSSGDSPWTSNHESSKHQSIHAIDGANDSSMIATAKGKDVSESSNTFEAGRQREVAAAGEATLGPLGLGLEDHSPMLKSKSIHDGPTSSKKSIFKGLFPNLTDTPSETWDAVPKEAFKAPEIHNFKFGESSGPVPFLGGGNCVSPRFGQDFNFGGSNCGVPFIATQKAPPSPRTPAPETLSTIASSAPEASSAASPPSTVPQAAPKQAVFNKDAMEQEHTAKTASDPNTPSKNQKKSKCKQPKIQAQKKAEHAFDGPNRKQRRAADRERKAAEKKAQAAAEKARKARAGANKDKQGGRSGPLGKAVVKS